ncbi:P1 family peptidase [Candidatus Uhrbacteria bacterium]|nr:P1 family peptidase [Candidatus Uhrbacteria bacterium]
MSAIIPTNGKSRFRDFGFSVGRLPAGDRCAITDVAGVRVGHETIVRDADIRTGVTIIDPGVADLYTGKLPAAVAVGNGAGKVAGFTQVEEFGTIEAPIALTNTLAVGPVTRGVIDLVLAQQPQMGPFDTINAVVGECNDGILSAIHRNVVTSAEVHAAYASRSADFAVGNVGAGTGTRAFSWKGGIGTASRRISVDDQTYTVGVLVQTNYGGALTVLGVPVGERLGKTDYAGFLPPAHDGSCMIIIATDAPVTHRQLRRIASRAFLGIARTGSIMRHPSGDYAVAFTTSRMGLEGSGAVGSCLRDEELTPFFLGTVDAIEESVYDALFAATTVRGRDGQVLEALPVDRVVPWIRAVMGCMEVRA